MCVCFSSHALSYQVRRGIRCDGASSPFRGVIIGGPTLLLQEHLQEELNQALTPWDSRIADVNWNANCIITHLFCMCPHPSRVKRLDQALLRGFAAFVFLLLDRTVEWNWFYFYFLWSETLSWKRSLMSTRCPFRFLCLSNSLRYQGTRWERAQHLTEEPCHLILNFLHAAPRRNEIKREVGS